VVNGLNIDGLKSNDFIVVVETLSICVCVNYYLLKITSDDPRAKHFVKEGFYGLGG
jgi:hypothetical protein